MNKNLTPAKNSLHCVPSFSKVLAVNGIFLKLDVNFFFPDFCKDDGTSLFLDKLHWSFSLSAFLYDGIQGFIGEKNRSNLEICMFI